MGTRAQFLKAAIRRTAGPVFALALWVVPAFGQAGNGLFQIQNMSPPSFPQPAGAVEQSEPSGDRPPKLMYAVRPRYPAAYAEKGVRGSVVVAFVVRWDGTVGDARAIDSPDPRLSDAAVAAVSQWMFRPGFKHGQPVDFSMEVPIVFKPPQNDARADPEAAALEAQTRGEEALAARDFVAALAAFDSALRFNPQNPDVVYERGVARQDLGEIHSALADFTEAIRLDPDEPRFHLSSAQVRELLHDAAGAVGECDIAARLTPDAAPVFSLRGEAYASEGRDDEALDDFDKSLALDPSDKAALDGKGRIEAKRAAWDPGKRAWSELRYRTFETVWSTVNDSYFDPAFGGVDWKAVREKYREQLPAVTDNIRLRYLLYLMLAELKKTHFEIIPREGAVFNPAERVRIGTAGTEVAFVEGYAAVKEVQPGSAGAAAGLKPGDRVTRVDDILIAQAMEPLVKAGIPAAKRGLYLTNFIQSRLEGPVGSHVRLGLLGANGARRDVVVTCRTNDAVWSEPMGHFPSMPIRCEAERGQAGIGYLRFNAFALPVMKPARSFLLSLQAGDGLIVDLRGNVGGVMVMAAGISGWLSDHEFSLGTTHSREGPFDLDVYPQEGAFGGPVAVLIDGRSASTSEVFAAGLQEAGRVRVFGEPSAGAAMPSLFKSLPNGDLFEYAVGDVTTPKSAVLEGRGVTPDETVVLTVADLAAGRDPVVDAARRWLDVQREGK